MSLATVVPSSDDYYSIISHYTLNIRKLDVDTNEKQCDAKKAGKRYILYNSFNSYSTTNRRCYISLYRGHIRVEFKYLTTSRSACRSEKIKAYFKIIIFFESLAQF